MSVARPIRVSHKKKYAPLGPRVTLTAFARMSTPFKMLARPSLENLISLWAPRASTGFAEAARRAAATERDLTWCISWRRSGWEGKERSGKLAPARKFF